MEEVVCDDKTWKSADLVNLDHHQRDPEYYRGGTLALLIIIGTLGIGLFCAPILILPMILGVAELIHGINLLSEPPKVKEPSQLIAILEICSILFGNIFAVMVGVFNLIISNDQEVKDYFASLS